MMLSMQARVDDLLALFSNRATMKMTDGVVIESDPEKLRDTFLSLTSSQPVIETISARSSPPVKLSCLLLTGL